MTHIRWSVLVVAAALAAALLPAGCSGSGRIPHTALSGRVLAADGTPPKLAHVHLPAGLEPGMKKRQDIQVAKDGTFRIEVPVGRPFHLSVSAVDHEEVRIPLYLEPDNPAPSVQITLPRNPYPDEFDEIKIVGDWNKFRWDNADAMKRQADGTWTWEGKVEGKEVAYELVGATTNGHSVNGTQADRYEYDGGGDYKSVVAVHDGKVRIVFDPSLLPAPGPEDLPRVEWDSAHEYLAKLTAMDREVGDANEALFEASKKYREAGGPPDKFTFDNSATVQRLTKAFHGDGPEPVRQWAAVSLLRVYAAAEEDPMKSEIAEILQAVPPESPIWGASAQSFERAMRLQEEDARGPLLDAFLEKSPIPEIRGQALAFKTALAKDAGDKKKWRRLYALLKKDYGDLRSVSYYIAALNPDKKIRTGQPVPEFTLKLMDGSTLTDKDLRGRYVLLDFWATWCGPCVQEMPNLDDAYKRFHDRNVEFVSISFDASPEDVQKFRKEKWPMPWKQAFAEKAFDSDLAKKFEVQGIPEPILVGPDGTILAVEPDTRGEQLAETLEKALKGGPKGPA